MFFNMRRFLLVSGVILLFIIIFSFFFSRAPVLVLTDAAFNGIYGENRARFSAFGLSLRLFRRVKPVLINDSAGADMVVFSLEAAASRPYCVLVPYRYAEGGRRYAEKYPLTPAAVLGNPPDLSEGASGGAAAGGIRYFRSGRETDFFRAGRCAAVLAGEGTVLVYHDRESAAVLAALREGLKREGCAKEPLFLNSGADPGNVQDIFCVILAGEAQPFLEKNLSIPVILFSWLDPALTPSEVKVIFDDSPWALAGEAVNRAAGGLEGDILPSGVIFPRGRNSGPVLERLKAAAMFP
jgi:hypothetical protein